MDYIKGFTFGWLYHSHSWSQKEAFYSLDQLIERTNINTIILPITAVQEHTYSTNVMYECEHVPTQTEIEKMIEYIQSKNIKIILKCVVNCLDGYWRAYINFFENDVICEPTWDEWFQSYSRYVNYVASFAQKYNVEMLIVGCEMVSTNQKSDDWRKVIHGARCIYKGLISYNCDKYQETNIDWWDAVDVISSSGYYPVKVWKKELQRIKKVVDKFKKPFFFAEAGCPSVEGSQYIPNNWSHQGKVSQEAQAEYYEEMFKESDKSDFVSGFGLWDWPTFLYPINEAKNDKKYSIYGKKAEHIVSEFYSAK